MLGVSALTLFGYHILLSGASFLIGMVILLMFGIPPKRPEHEPAKRHVGHHLLDFVHAFWPIGFTAGLYVVLDVPPAIGILLAIVGLLILHRVPFRRWPGIFKAAREPDMVFLIIGALFFKLNLEAAGAIGSVVDFLTGARVPPHLLLFVLPMLVGFSTGVTVATVAMTYPFLIAFIGTGTEVKMGLETLAFSGLLFGLWLSPIHLCIALSASYFETSMLKIISKLILPAIGVAVVGALLAAFLG
jgi:hypothetical protein